MAKAKVNDITLYYKIYGKGEPLIFISGFSSDHTAWLNIVEEYAKQYQVILFDNRGVGQSDAPDFPYTIEMMADDVKGLCDVLQISSAHFIGHSMGGMILQTLAYRYPNYVKSAIIYSSMMKIDYRFQLFSEGRLKLMELNISPEILVRGGAFWSFTPEFLQNNINAIVDLRLANPFPITPEGFKNQLHALTQFDSAVWISRIETPCLVLGSDRDLISEESHMKKIAKLIPKAIYHSFEEQSHATHIEEPERFNKIVLNFLTKQIYKDKALN